MNFSSRLGSIPPATKNIIIINLLIWLVEIIFPRFGDEGIIRHLGLHYVTSDLFNPAQIITYMFVHDNHSFLHIFFNMFTLWMFGRILEQVWGTKRFLFYYAVCGVGAALVQEAVWAFTWQHSFAEAIASLNGITYDSARQMIDQAIASGNGEYLKAVAEYKNYAMVTIGASGAIFGLLLGFAFVFPNMPLYLFFIPIPIKAKWMVLGYAVLEFFLGVTANDTIAHFAHLGGLLFGLVLLLIWRKKGTLRGNSFYQ